MITTYLIDDVGADIARVRLPSPPAFGQRFELAGGTFVVVGAAQRVLRAAPPFPVIAVDEPPRPAVDGDEFVVQVHLLTPPEATPLRASPSNEVIQVGQVRALSEPSAT